MTALSKTALLSFLASNALLASLASAQRYVPVSGTVPFRAPESIAYDSVRDECIGLALDGKVWKHDGTQWSELKLNPSPPLRYEGAIVFDGKRVLVYGGQGVNNALADFWAYDGSKWTQLSANAAPGLRRGHAMAYDSARDRVVLTGGTDMQSGFPNDTWEWDGKTWKQFQSGTGSRVWHSMAYDPIRKKTVLAGGAMNPYLLTDTWEWDGASWTQTITSGAPVRLLGTLVYDARTQRVLGLGGQQNHGVQSYDFTGKAWNEVLKSLPCSSVVSGAAYDTKRGRTLFAADDLFRACSGYVYDGGVGTYASFADGCSVTQPQPQLAAAAGSAPLRGKTFRAEIRRSGTAPAAALLTGFSNTSWGSVQLPLPVSGMPGCSLLVAPELMIVLPFDARTGVASFSVAIPASLGVGVKYYQQAVTLDANAPSGLGAWSDGMLCHIR